MVISGINNARTSSFQSWPVTWFIGRLSSLLFQTRWNFVKHIKEFLVYCVSLPNPELKRFHCFITAKYLLFLRYLAVQVHALENWKRNTAEKSNVLRDHIFLNNKKTTGKKKDCTLCKRNNLQNLGVESMSYLQNMAVKMGHLALQWLFQSFILWFQVHQISFGRNL